MAYQGNLLSKTLVIGIIILFIGMNIVTSTGTKFEKSYKNSQCSPTNPQYSPHDPIYIDGNYEFTSENGVTGGMGWVNDPYIIEGWEINASSEDGITIVDTNKCFEIRNCYIHSGGSSKDGIVFYHVINGVINSSIISNNRFGIIFRQYDYYLGEDSSYNKIMNNTITNNKRDGIYFEHTINDYHSYNQIFLNEISYNDQGIYMIMSAYNQIFSNNIISNTRWGVNLTMCMAGGQNNKVYHNNFIVNNNENGQACAWWTLGNDWDDGYPSGGNFWSDYNGIDSDGDGIGDTPYEILVYEEYYNDYDYYPLIEPWGDNLPPFADFTWIPTHPDPEEIILFNASESIDYDGYITLYEWDWDNDGEYDENYTNPTAFHTFEEAEYYPVTLRVHDNESKNDTKTKTIRVGNNPPYEPSDPIPPDGAENWTGGGLCWTGGDPDGDLVTYDVYFGKSSPPPQIVANQSGNCTVPHGSPEINTTYYWKIIAWDEYGASTHGPIWSFTTEPNYPPDPPHDEIPPNGSCNVPGDAILCWNGTDPNSGDELTYDVYFSTSYPPILVSPNQTEPFYDPYGPSDMPLLVEYYWRIVSWDREGEGTSSPIWSFNTGPYYLTNPEIDGPNRGVPGIDYKFTFVSTNPDNISIKYYVDWDDGTTIETDYYEVGEVVTLTHNWTEEGDYKISAQAEDNYGVQSGKSYHQINIPRSRTVNLNTNLLSWLFERFPLLEKLLNLIKVI